MDVLTDEWVKNSLLNRKGFEAATWHFMHKRATWQKYLCLPTRIFPKFTYRIGSPFWKFYQGADRTRLNALLGHILCSQMQLILEISVVQCEGRVTLSRQGVTLDLSSHQHSSRIQVLRNRQEINCSAYSFYLFFFNYWSLEQHYHSIGSFYTLHCCRPECSWSWGDYAIVCISLHSLAVVQV